MIVALVLAVWVVLAAAGAAALARVVRAREHAPVALPLPGAAPVHQPPAAAALRIVGATGEGAEGSLTAA